MKAILDIEGNGLRENCTVIHCATLKEVDGKLLKVFADIPEDVHPTIVGFHKEIYSINQLINDLEMVDVLVGHNIIGYYLPVIEKLLKYRYKRGKLDTLVWSKVLNPDRQLPKGCPTTIFNHQTGKNEKIGPHSLHAWGYRVNMGKPEHFDWDRVSVGMIMRNITDVKINELVYKELCREAELERY